MISVFCYPDVISKEAERRISLRLVINNNIILSWFFLFNNKISESFCFRFSFIRSTLTTALSVKIQDFVDVVLDLLIKYENEYISQIIDGHIVIWHKEERQVTKPTYPATKLPLNVPDLETLVPAPELSLPILCVVIITKGIIFYIHERQFWSGNESVEIR